MVFSPIASLANSAWDVAATPRQLQTQGSFGYVPMQTTPKPSLWDSSDGSSLSGSASDFSFEPLKSSDGSSMDSSGSTSGDIEIGYEWLTGWLAYVAALFLMLIFGLIYFERVVEPVIHTKGTLTRAFVFRNSAEDFHYNIFECLYDQWTCILGCCCPIVRMAHTNAVAGIMGFWQSACFHCLAECFGCGRCLIVYWRLRLKEIMIIEGNFFTDFIVTCCCPYLSICQQASSVDHEFQYEVTDCCTLSWYDEETNMALEMAPDMGRYG